MKKIVVIILAFLTGAMYANSERDQQLIDVILQRGSNRPTMVETLLLLGANPNAQRDGKTAIMHQIENFTDRVDASILEYLLETARKNNGLDFIAGNGMTALTFAADFGYTDPMNLLLSAGADSEVKDAYGKTMDDYLATNRVQREKERKERELARLQKEFIEINPEEEDWTLIEVGGKYEV